MAGNQASQESSEVRLVPHEQDRLGLLSAHFVEDLLRIGRRLERLSLPELARQAQGLHHRLRRLSRSDVRRREHQIDAGLELRQASGNLARPLLPQVGERPVRVAPGLRAVLRGGVAEQPDLHSLQV